MSDNSKIEWTEATWNPVTGCTEVSRGCDYCYAGTFAERWRGIPGHYFEHGFDVTLRPGKLSQPLRWQRPRRIFVNSMSDLFHDAVPDAFIAEVFAVMARAQQHTFQLLTKRHRRMRSLLSRPSFRDNLAHLAPWPLPNLWLGVSVEDQHWADIRVPVLCETPAAVRWLSCEPLLGEVSLHALYDHFPWSYTEFGTLCACGAAMKGEICTGGTGIGWVVAGGESGPGARACELEWLRSLRDQCAEMGTPFFCKQLGAVTGRAAGAGPKGGDWAAWPEDLKVREFPCEPCRTCDGSGILMVPDAGGESSGEQACPDPVHDRAEATA